MAQVIMARLYNTLPTLGQADLAFDKRESIFETLTALLAKYDGVFGLCLVHAHCKLADGEMMLAIGNISQPVRSSDAGTHYPERWLSSGEPYEFTDRATTEPPMNLVHEFRQIVEAAQLQDVLGLYHIDKSKDIVPVLEWTDGRKNLTREMTQEDLLGKPVQTAWDFGRGDPVTMGCRIYCDTRVTRSGLKNVHKGKII